MTKEFVFHALISKETCDESDVWVAQGLEYDIVVQAPTEAELHQRVQQTVTAHITSSVNQGEDPLASLTRLGEAPFEFWKTYLKSIEEEKSVDLPAKSGFFRNLASVKDDILAGLPSGRLLVRQAQFA